MRLRLRLHQRCSESERRADPLFVPGTSTHALCGCKRVGAALDRIHVLFSIVKTRR